MLRIRAIPVGATELFLTVEPARQPSDPLPETPTPPILALTAPVLTPP